MVTISQAGYREEGEGPGFGSKVIKTETLEMMFEFEEP